MEMVSENSKSKQEVLHLLSDPRGIHSGSCQLSCKIMRYMRKLYREDTWKDRSQRAHRCPNYSNSSARHLNEEAFKCPLPKHQATGTCEHSLVKMPN